MGYKRQELNKRDLIFTDRLAMIVRAILKIGTGVACFIAGEKFLILWAVVMIIWKLNNLKEQS